MSAAKAKVALVGSLTIFVPQWNRSHVATACDAQSDASSQTGVSWSHNVKVQAAAAGDNGDGDVTSAPIRQTLPGRDVA